ncbi:hypothetical protein E4T56_gene13993, partial [Termitomyces sp. T112]
MEAFLLVADVLDRLPHHAFDLLAGHRLRTTRFTGDHHLVGGGKRFAGRADLPGIDAGFRPFAVEQVDDLVGDTVTDLVWMSLGNGLAGEQIGRAHRIPSCCAGPPAAFVRFVVKPEPVMFAQN